MRQRDVRWESEMFQTNGSMVVASAEWRFSNSEVLSISVFQQFHFWESTADKQIYILPHRCLLYYVFVSFLATRIMNPAGALSGWHWNFSPTQPCCTVVPARCESAVCHHFLRSVSGLGRSRPFGSADRKQRGSFAPIVQWSGFRSEPILITGGCCLIPIWIIKIPS